MFYEISLIAYLVDRRFGEFSFIVHPVVLMGKLITFFETHFYKDSILRGALLWGFVVGVVFVCSFTLTYIDNVFILGLIASTGIASKMLYEHVKEIIIRPSKIRFLVSRDTQALSKSDINKAAIETYAENLSDGVIAPLFYLVIFGVVGLFSYKAINTLDSMVGYKNTRYEKFGKFSAYMDDIANYIPSRITAVMIALFFFSRNALHTILKDAHKHQSPNAGYPISAMAGALHLRLGGDTPYFGKIHKKPYFGNGKKNITKNDITRALLVQIKIDSFVIILLSVFIFL